MTAEVVDLLRQVLLHRPRHTRIEKLGSFSAVEVSVQIGGVVQNLDISVRRRPPINEGHERAGVTLEGRSIIIYAVEHDGGDREYHAGGRELTFCQDVMDQASVDTAIAVLKRV